MFTIDDFSGDAVTSRKLRINRIPSRDASGKCSIAGIAGAIVGGALIGGITSARGASKAAGAQRDAANQASDTQLQASRESNALQEKMFNQQTRLYNQQIQRQEPNRQAGLSAQNRLLEVLALGGNNKAAGYGSANNKFQEQNLTMDPGYQFRLQEGQKALERSAAARGGLFSGRAAKDLQSYGQGMASQEYGNAYNRAYGRFQDERNNLLQPLQSLSGLAQTATSAQGQASQNFSNQAGAYGQSVGNNMMNTGNQIAGNQIGAGNARASGYVGQANSLNSIIGGGVNAYQNYDMMNKLFPSSK